MRYHWAVVGERYSGQHQQRLQLDHVLGVVLHVLRRFHLWTVERLLLLHHCTQRQLRVVRQQRDVLSGHFNWSEHGHVLQLGLGVRQLPGVSDRCPDDVRAIWQQLLLLDLVLRLHRGAVGQLWVVRQLEHLLAGNCHRPQRGQLHLVGLAEQ